MLENNQPPLASRTAQPELPDPVEANQLNPEDLIPLLEALLLAAPEPTTPDELARTVGLTVDVIESGLVALQRQDDRGWVVQRHGDRVQLGTAPRFAPYVRRFLHLDREARLSAAALETLAIISYQQPVTRAEVEAVRGVDCVGVLATLHGRGLIEAVGKRPTVGNPIQYGTTSGFLRHFGLRSLADLPAIGTVGDRDGRLILEAVIAAADADPSVTDAQRETGNE